ncbi:MAG: aminotransferase class IV [Immundisolibacteraceae bacterium]|nr:aminotransferase class IV [Immundisolibacteraceae bacterium]
MEIIEAIEQGPRGLYTGAIGWLAPDRHGQFNVAIRTARLAKNSTVSYGVGGGIVWDSDPVQEAQECIDKSRVLAQPPLPDVALLETLRWSPAEGYWLLSEHLQRLAESALFLNYVIDQQQVLVDLKRAINGFGQHPQRVRLTLTKQGKVEISHQPLRPSPIPVKLVLYDKPMLDSDPLRFHKSDPRPWLSEVADPASVGADDWLFINSRGEITESTIANLVIRIGSHWITPALGSGLLAGTYRRRLIRTGVLTEQVITQPMLQTAAEIGLINSVRGWRQAILLKTTH